MLTHLRIQGFRCLQDTATDLTPITVFIGPNDSGKSSILDSLYALSRVAREGIERHVLEQWAFDRFALPEAMNDSTRIANQPNNERGLRVSMSETRVS